MKIRRLVTGNNAKGESTFVSLGFAPRSHDFVHIPGMSVTQLWSTTALPGLPAPLSDPTLNAVSILPSPGGTKLMIVTFPPDSVMSDVVFNPEAAKAEMSAACPGLAESFESSDPGMHTTDSIDYGIVLSGRISLQLDGGRIECLGAGDVVIQNGTRHAWRNPGAVPASVAFVLIGAQRGA